MTTPATKNAIAEAQVNALSSADAKRIRLSDLLGDDLGITLCNL